MKMNAVEIAEARSAIRDDFAERVGRRPLRRRQDRPVRPYYADVPVCLICGVAHHGGRGSGGWCGIRGGLLFEAAA